MQFLSADAFGRTRPAAFYLPWLVHPMAVNIKCRMHRLWAASCPLSPSFHEVCRASLQDSGLAASWRCQLSLLLFATQNACVVFCLFFFFPPTLLLAASAIALQRGL